jgi:hypothetical protein
MAAIPNLYPLVDSVPIPFLARDRAPSSFYHRFSDLTADTVGMAILGPGTPSTDSGLVQHTDKSFSMAGTSSTIPESMRWPTVL